MLYEPEVNEGTAKASGEKNKEALNQLIEPNHPDFVDKASYENQMWPQQQHE